MRWLPLARFRVEDDSMEPSLEAGDYVLVNTWSYLHRRPKEGDLVVVRSPEDPDRFLVKRIASVMDSGDVFVLGDSRTRSRDSRHFGPVPRRQIVGKVWIRARR